MKWKLHRKITAAKVVAKTEGSVTIEPTELTDEQRQTLILKSRGFNSEGAKAMLMRNAILYGRSNK